MPTPEKLFQNHELFELIVAASPAGMIITNAEGEIVLANPRAEALFGYEVGELRHSKIERLLPAAHHSAHIEARSCYMAHPKTRTMAEGRDLFGLRKDGNEFPVDISLHPFTVGDSVLVLANVLDATDRKRAEKKREQDEAMKRLALLGQLAGGVAHEIRTPLCVIRNDAYFLSMLTDSLEPEAAECVKEINEAVGKADNIVSELLDFTRESPSTRSNTPLSKILSAAVKAAILPNRIHFECPPNDDQTDVLVDANQIERVLVNLFRNACQAIEGEGTIRVEIETCRSHVKVRVIDSGPGIHRENIDRIFEPLFTTKPKGIGLGLAISRRYVERNRGTLSVKNLPTGGACFELVLPRIETHDNER